MSETFPEIKPGDFFLSGKVIGHNLDPVDVEAGMMELIQCGYLPKTDPFTFEVIQYALQRWGRGEEAQAEKGAIDKSFHGVDLTTWRRVLAAALASGKIKFDEAKKAQA